jgi:predicted RNA-binding Zn-ribbon protein involved in translation (DUF1610 family)
MRSGYCPKCHSTTIYRKEAGIIFSNNPAFTVRVRWTDLFTRYFSYVCSSCGYFENYIADPEKLKKVAQKWQKVPPRPK